jgi:hypothetical protein
LLILFIKLSIPLFVHPDESVEESNDLPLFLLLLRSNTIGPDPKTQIVVATLENNPTTASPIEPEVR